MIFSSSLRQAKREKNFLFKLKSFAFANHIDILVYRILNLNVFRGINFLKISETNYYP